MKKAYIAIDMKSFYASVECVQRRLDPLRARLLVADESRSDQTICLAVSPALKAIGVPSRPRLFEAKEAIRRYEALHHTRVDYIAAVPQMEKYERVSAQIYSILLQYAGPEHVHVYSIDESFIDCTPYLHLYADAARAAGVTPPHQMAMTIIRHVLKATGITATVGIGTNMYLAKVAMDIVAKKAKSDQDGVRIAELDERSYQLLLWDHAPLTDFWQIGSGKAERLQRAGMYTMGDIATRAICDEEWFYQNFGIDAEILIDHAWGIEPVEMSDIKGYRTDAHSLSSGQVLARPYRYEEARTVFLEMADGLCADLAVKNLVCRSLTWYAAYDWKSLEENPGYAGQVCMDWYGRLHPRHSLGTVRLKSETNSVRLISGALLASFSEKTDHSLLFRRLNISANDVSADSGCYQPDFFTDDCSLEKERKIQAAMLSVRRRFGANAVFRGFNLVEGATALERNGQIGGHRK